MDMFITVRFGSLRHGLLCSFRVHMLCMHYIGALYPSVAYLVEAGVDTVIRT
jgi:hypothetical protein